MEKYRFSQQEQAILEGLQQPFAVYQFVDKRVVTLVLSDGFCELFGYTDRNQAYWDMDHQMYRDTHSDDAARIAEAAYRFATEGGDYEVIYRSKTGTSAEYRIIHAKGKHVTTADGVRLAHVWYLDEGACVDHDSAHRTELNETLSNALHEESILKATQYDFLTGLPNMTYFFELAEAGKEAMQQRGENAVMLFMDLIGMKFFNSKHGFAEGDKLLQAFAGELRQAFGSESCCHISGDHFLAFTEDTGLEERLDRMLRECRELNGGNSLPVRVGVYPDHLENVPPSVACDRAKFACDALRNVFASSVNYYDADLKRKAERRQYILSHLDQAIREKWIQVYYQPIVRTVNGSISDEEALARWIDPEHGFLSPAEFIPFLEEAGLIYKLDLYVVDQVLEKLRLLRERGLVLAPQSVNLSRADFDACDIVEEIRARVDAAGLPRDLLTVEITESVIGGDFDFMKAQVERFQKLGFPVWMDDFGSGYSSLDVLQSVQFDLIKFDMGFMRKLNEGESGRIVLTELMKLATSLGVGTVCEGVETEEQSRFLREIGCGKLQGYLYARPAPLEQSLAFQEAGAPLGYENPAESEYYEIMGRVNLYDFAGITSEEEDGFQRFFNTLPMGIIEVRGDTTRFVRSNQSYRDFIRQYIGLNLSYEGTDFAKFGDTFMRNVVKTCCEQGLRSFYDEKMPDGSVVHSFARRLAINPVNGTYALAVVVLSITDPNDSMTYAEIARALAADYYNIYYVDLETDHYIEYSSTVGGEELALERHGEDFFNSARRDTMVRIYEADRQPFLSAFTKENVLQELDAQGVFTATYRLIDTGTPMYVNMKIMRMQPDGKHLIIGISIVDTQMRQQEATNTLLREESAYVRIMALSGDYLSLYTINPDTGCYIEYSTSSEYESLGFAKRGEDFFRQGIIDGKKVVFPDDLPMYLDHFTKEKILEEIRQNGLYQLQYSLMLNGEPQPVVLKIVSVQENDEEKLIAGIRPWRKRR